MQVQPNDEPMINSNFGTIKGLTNCFGTLFNPVDIILGYF